MKKFRVMFSFYFCFMAVALFLLLNVAPAHAQSPAPAGWYSGDMHVHRSCGGGPVPVGREFRPGQLGISAATPRDFLSLIRPRT